MNDIPEQPLLEPLTEREQEILQWIADGLSNQEIGERLFLSTGTIKWHIKNIYGKLGVHKRTAAVVRGRALGLLRIDAAEAMPRISERAHNLPPQTTSFVGRDADAASVLALLADPSCRLITLVGPGGIGKTRLAIHCAGQLIEQFQDGIVFVGLESVPSPDFLASAIAEALQLHIYTQEDLRQQVINRLRHKKLLLLLDNFEHLLDEAAFVARLVAAAPTIKVLVTSREGLNLSDEWLYPVDGLAVPDSADQNNLEAFGATKLFIERARRVRNDFSVSTESPWLTRICQIVGGMPLAIELLTPWLQVLTCREIVQEIEHNRDFLAANRRDLPERHRSIRAVFEHSWALLTTQEQTVFMKSAVFRGGFTREAVEFVAAASLPTLAALVNKSLISPEREGRYELHDLIRHYAEEKLQESSEEEVPRFRHSRYYADFLQRIVRGAQPGQRTTEAGLRDLDNVLSGALYAVRHGRVEEIAAYAEGLWQYFEAKGWYPAEAGLIDLYRDAIAVMEDATRRRNMLDAANPALVRLYESLAALLYSRRNYEEARVALEQGLKYSPSEDRLTTARLYRKIGDIYVAQRINTELVHPMFVAAERALGSEPTEDAQGWWWEWIQIHLDVVWLYYVRTEIGAMIQRIEKVQGVIERHGTPGQKSKLFSNRMLLELRRHMYRDFPDETLNYAQSALDAARQVGDLREIAWLQFSLGFAHLWRDEFDPAEQQFLPALALAEQAGDSMATQPTALAYLPLIYRRRQQVDEVEKWARMGLRSAADANAIVYVAASNAHLGWVFARRGSLADAKQHLETALRQWSELTTIYPFQWLASVPLLALALDSGQIEQAIGYAHRLLQPTQQQLIGDLPALLQNAVQSWEDNHSEAAHALLHTFCEQAIPLGYL